MVRAVTDLEVPVHAIRGVTDGKLQVSVNRGAVSEVDDEETAHRMGQEAERRAPRAIGYR